MAEAVRACLKFSVWQQLLRQRMLAARLETSGWKNFDKNKPGNADELPVPLIVMIKFRKCL